MKSNLLILIFLTLSSCTDSKKIKNSINSERLNTSQADICNYTNSYKDVGNRMIDTIHIGKNLVDPIDDFTNFIKADFDFVKRDDRIFKKSKTHRNCNSKHIIVEYYQEFTNRIDLSTYMDYDEIFFTTKGEVKFWWVNSDGLLIYPVNNADPITFKPFKDICGGIDKNRMYYGCPNYGVYSLDIALTSEYQFIAKEDNYWNSPKHYVIIDNVVYDMKYELNKGYFYELNKTHTLGEIKKMRPK